MAKEDRTLAEIEKAEERQLKLHERALANPEGEEARIVQAAEVYAVRFGVSLATAIAAVKRMEKSS